VLNPAAIGRYALTLVAIVAVTTAAPDAHACTLRLGWEPYAVFTYEGKDGEPRGVDIDVLRQIADTAGCSVEFRKLPWARILVEIESGQIDVASSVKYIPVRDAFALFSIPYRRGELALFARRGEVHRLLIGSIDEWPRTGRRLGFVNAYSFGSDIDASLAKAEIAALSDGSPDYATGIRMLVTGRTDAFLAEDVNVMIGEARTLGVEAAIERHPLVLPPSDYHLMFSRASVPPDLVSIADRVIARMRRDGSIDRLTQYHREPR
jgi:polar amino acid transport system substrate-binding protein